jgi:hypothetical protein
LVAASIVFQVACAQEERLKFDLSSFAVTGESTPTVEMQAGEARTIQLIAIGPAGESITFSASNLPEFARLDGALLSLAPSRANAGEYTITIAARTATQSQAADLRVVVRRYNEAPILNDTSIFLGDENVPLRNSLICPGREWCTLYGRAKVYVGVCDGDGDAVTVDVEVVPRGTPFSRSPSVSISAPVGRNQNDTCGSGPGQCVCVELPLGDLPPDTSYDFAVRVSDAYGAIGTAKYGGTQDGWTSSARFGFDEGPCSSDQCACIPSGPKSSPLCMGAEDCCSLVCQSGQCL